MKRIFRQSLPVVSLVALLLGCSSGDSSSVPKQPAADAAAVDGQRHDFGDFSFELPAGWTRAKPDREQTQALLLLDGQSRRDAKGSIMVDVGRPAMETPDELARSFAANAAGTVTPDKVDIDGAAAVKATAPNTTLSKPRLMLVVYRNDKAYLIMAFAKEGVDPTDALEHVRATWKWAK